MPETTLIPMLGSNQVEEFVLYPKTTIEDVSPTLTDNGVLQPLSKVRIEYNLDEVELNHSRDRDDDVFSLFSGEGLPGNMACCYLIEGEARLICLCRRRNGDRHCCCATTTTANAGSARPTCASRKARLTPGCIFPRVSTFLTG
jgi:hypothetical protein